MVVAPSEYFLLESMPADGPDKSLVFPDTMCPVFIVDDGRIEGGPTLELVSLK